MYAANKPPLEAIYLKHLASTDVDAYLQHVGVKGMKWGHRKSKTDSKARKRTKGVHTLKRALKGAAIGAFVVFGSNAVASAMIGRAPGIRTGPTRGQTRTSTFVNVVTRPGVLRVPSERMRPIAALTAGREAVERLRG